MNQPKEERRRFPRCQIPCKTYVYLPSNKIISTFTQDISRNGVKISIPKKLDIGSNVNLEVHGETEPMLCEGKVVWIKKSNKAKTKAGLYDTGIMFLKIEYVNNP